MLAREGFGTLFLGASTEVSKINKKVSPTIETSGFTSLEVDSKLSREVGTPDSSFKSVRC